MNKLTVKEFVENKTQGTDIQFTFDIYFKDKCDCNLTNYSVINYYGSMYVDYYCYKNSVHIELFLLEE